MSGLYGFAAKKGMSDPGAMLARMHQAIQTRWPSIKHHWTAQGGHAGLAAIHPARTGVPGHAAKNLSAGIHCVFDGVCYADADVPVRKTVKPNGAAVLLERYLESGTQCLPKISGSFNVAWWDEKARRLVLANDKLGHRLLFWSLGDDVLVFAPSFPND